MRDLIPEADRNTIAAESIKLINNSNLPTEFSEGVLKILTRLRSPLESTSSAQPTDNSEISRWLAEMIDHTLLKPDATTTEFEKVCSEAREFGFATVCVPPNQVAFCSKLLAGASSKVITVIGFPLGYATGESMQQEAALAIEAGAEEVDMVIPYGKLLSGDLATVYDSVAHVVSAASPKSIPVKAILESAVLNDTQLAMASAIAIHAGASFVKTSTGFSAAGGASERALQIMRILSGPKGGVKASGGIRDQEAALRMIAAGANRIGASASIAITNGNSGSKSENY